MYSNAWLNSDNKDAKGVRIRLRYFALRTYVECQGDLSLCKAATTRRALHKEGVGNLIVVLTIGALLIQIAFTAYKFWKEMNYAQPPNVPVDGEPFRKSDYD